MRGPRDATFGRVQNQSLGPINLQLLYALEAMIKYCAQIWKIQEPLHQRIAAADGPLEPDSGADDRVRVEQPAGDNGAEDLPHADRLGPVLPDAGKKHEAVGSDAPVFERDAVKQGVVRIICS